MNESFNPYQAQIDFITAQIAQNEQLLADPELAELAQQEIEKLNQEKQALETAAQEYESNLEDDTPQATSTEKSKAIIEIRGGTGGDEAKIWARDLLRMYMRFCENKGLQISFIDDLVFKVSGRTEIELSEEEPASIIYPYELFKYESGVHRVQRVPVTEAQGRVHTSTASVAVLPEIHEKAISIRDEDLIWEFMRASGAGGQSVNKTSSAVRLTHKPSGIVVVSRQERKQAQNRQIALELLRSQLWEIEEEKRLEQIGEARSVIGRNMRAEKIRTYNYPQNRVTDHRINHSWYALETIIEGDLEKVITLVKNQLENGNSEDKTEPTATDQTAES